MSQTEFSTSSKFVGPVLPNYLDERHPLKGTKVLETLEIDSGHRYAGVTDDIISIDNIVWSADPNFEKYQRCLRNTNHSAVLYNLSDYKASHYFNKPFYSPFRDVYSKKNSTNKEFQKHFNNCAPFFDHFNWRNVVLAGGAVSNVLLGSEYIDSDFDLFVYGLNDEQASNRVKMIVNHFLDFCDHNNCYRVHMMVKSENLLQIYLQKLDEDNKYAVEQTYEIQVIFRLYQTLSEVLHGFDLGSSAVGYDGTQVYFTTLSQYAYANMTNILDTTRRSTTYELRLAKYQKRGFRVVLPDLKTIHRTTEPMNGPVYSNEYLTTGHYGHVYLNMSRYLAQQTPPYRVGLFDYKLDDARPCKTVAEILGESFHHNKLVLASVQKLKQFVKQESHYLSKNEYRMSKNTRVKDWIYRHGKDSLIHYLETGEKPDRMFYDDLETWEHERISRVPEYLTFLKENLFKIDWKTQDPGTQLTSSFNPVIADSREWYGMLHWSFENGGKGDISDLVVMDQKSDDFEILPDCPDKVYGNIDKFIENPN